MTVIKKAGVLGSPFETGRPVTLFFARNSDSSRNYAPAGMDLGTGTEPDGEYLVVSERTLSHGEAEPCWSYGKISYKNPVVLEFKNTRSTGWKKDLSEMFDGKTGAALTIAIKKSGYDGVVTVEEYRGRYELNESVNISGTKQKDN